MKKVIIIGGGVAGLSAGCYAQMNGFNSEIYEMHSISGGLCTAWKRKEYIFDGCLHWLVGTSPLNPFYRIWEELGVLKGKKFFSYEYYKKVIDENGKVFTLYVNPDRLREEMLEHSKQDRKIICKVTEDLRKLMKHKMPIDYTFFTILKMLPLFLLFKKYSMGAEEFSSLFQNKNLRKFISFAFDWHNMSVVFILWAMSLMADGDAQYVLGGSMEISKSIEERYKSLGGKIFFNKKVKKIIVENDSAVGIILSDDTEVRGDVVISAADGYTTIFNWLEGKYINDKIQKHYKELETFPPLIYISLGLNADYSKEPYELQLLLKDEIEIAGQKVKLLEFTNKSFDKILTKEGKSTLQFMIPTDYEYWKNLYKDKNKYNDTKNKIANDVINKVAEFYPDIKNQIEVIDVATPITFERYTGNWKASYEGWLLTKKSMTVQFPQQLPNLNNFYMAGHWLSTGGGIPAAALTARNAVRLLCHNNKIKFTTSTL